MICHRCGKIFQEGYEFCPGCGLELTGVKPPGDHVCPPTSGTSQQHDSTSPVLYAGFWRRVVALFVDRFLLGFVNLFLCGFFFLLSGMEWNSDNLGTLYLTSSVFGFMLRWLYYTLLESSALQATLGKALIGIKVTDEQRRRISLIRANARHWAKILSTLTLGFGYLMAGFTRRKQALHDFVAGTLVVRG